MATLRGTYAANKLTYTQWADLIDGQGGNDTITAGRGNDTVYAGDGNDKIDFTGAFAWLKVYGGSGNDTITGSIKSGASAQVYGDSGNDVITVTSYEGNATLNGGAGNDSIVGSGWRVRLEGGDGDDLLMASATAMKVGNLVTIDPGKGADIIYCHRGADHIRFRPYEGADTVYNFEGNGPDKMLIAGTPANFKAVDKGDNVDVYYGGVKLATLFTTDVITAADDVLFV